SRRSIPPEGERTVTTTASGCHGAAGAGTAPPAANGRTSTRQRWPASSPDKLPSASSSRFGRPATTARAVSTSATSASTLRAPRAEVATSAPMAASEAAPPASATSASMIVNPALPGRRSKIARDNFDSSGEPANPDLVTDAETAEHDGAAAGHSGRKEADRRE